MGMERPDMALRVACAWGPEFYVRWMRFLKPYHGLPDSETRLAGMMLWRRAELSRSVADDVLLDEALLSQVGRAELCALCGVTPQRLQVAIGKFRKCGLLAGGRVDLKYVPPVAEGARGCSLLIWFDFT